MASSFSDSLMAPGRWKHLPEILKTTKGMTMNFLPDVGTQWRHKIKIKFDIVGLVCKLQTKIPKVPIFGNATLQFFFWIFFDFLSF